VHLRTRQRVIGLLLLLLLAAILAPLVLRSPEQVRLALDMSIPEAPRISEPDIAPVVSEEEQAATDRQIDEEQQQVATAEPAPQAVEEEPLAEQEPSAQQGPSAQQEPPAATPEPAPQDAPQPGFTVQVASFSDVANAQALVARLREAGYSAYHREVQQDGNTWQRVFVGPEIQRERAEALRQRLADDKAFALEGLVRSFVP